MTAALRSPPPKLSPDGDAGDRAEWVLPRATDFPGTWSATGAVDLQFDVPLTIDASCRLPDDPALAAGWSVEHGDDETLLAVTAERLRAAGRG